MNVQNSLIESTPCVNSTAEQLNTVCQTCLNENDQRNTIDHLDISTILRYCFNINIKSSENTFGRFCTICSKCTSGLCHAYAFKKQIENSLKLYEARLVSDTNDIEISSLDKKDDSDEINKSTNITMESVKVYIKREMDDKEYIGNDSIRINNTANQINNDINKPKANKRNSYKSLTLQEKLSAIDDIEKGKKIKDVAVAYGVKNNTLSTIFKNRQNLKNQLSKNPAQLNKKRLRMGEYLKIDEAIVCFVSEARKNHLPVNGRIIQEKAKQYGEEFNIGKFKASNGWFDRLKKRTGI